VQQLAALDGRRVGPAACRRAGGADRRVDLLGRRQRDRRQRAPRVGVLDVERRADSGDLLARDQQGVSIAAQHM
jgi:hypothetical protein